MQASTRLIALRAATKVTLSVAMFGCGGATVTADGDSGSVSHIDDTDAAHSSVSPKEDGGSHEGSVVNATDSGRDVVLLADAESRCPGATSHTKGTVSEDTFTCCTTLLAAGQDVDADTQLELDAASPPSKECCASIIAFVDGDGGFAAFEKAAPFLSSCCEAAGRPDGPACTPWGPPMPPAMFNDLEVA